MTTSKAYADCQPIYGGGVACQPTALVISKTVLNPQTNVYVHDLGINDPRFRPGDSIAFQISVTNTGTQNVGPVRVTDVFPSGITFVQGQHDIGTFDSSTHTFSYFIPIVMAGETQSLVINAQVMDASQFPQNQDTLCETNQATAGTDSSNAITQDSAQFCIFHPVTAAPVPSTIPSPPSTGPETLPLLGLLGSGATGIVLRKLSKEKRSVV